MAKRAVLQVIKDRAKAMTFGVGLFSERAMCGAGHFLSISASNKWFSAALPQAAKPIPTSPASMVEDAGYVMASAPYPRD